jgi:hypothetical protein
LIYFLRAMQDSDLIKAGWIKIGTTTRLSVRLKQIAAEIGHMPTVLAVLDGGFAEEQALHRKFGFARKLGEWFGPDPELLQLIGTEGRPWDGLNDGPESNLLISYKADPQTYDTFKEWMEGLAEHVGVPVTIMLDMALKVFAEKHKYRPIPKRLAR